MFRSVLETMLAIQVRLRRRGVVIRQMLSEFRPDWAAVPLEHGYPAMPATWKTLHKFLPVLGHYGRKAASKVLGKFGGHRERNPPQPGSTPIRLQLWSEERVRTVLDYRTMSLNGLLDPAALRDFLKKSENAGFPFDAEWRRLLSLEYTLRTLKGARAKRFA